VRIPFFERGLKRNTGALKKKERGDVKGMQRLFLMYTVYFFVSFQLKII
jgi:hypothetical protein